MERMFRIRSTGGQKRFKVKEYIPVHNYLKYWRVVKYYICRKYGISYNDLDMLLFLYSEQTFTAVTFQMYDNIFSWDKGRLSRLVEQGWIVKLKYDGVYRDTRDMFSITTKTRRVMKLLYKYLDKGKIPESRWINPLFKKNVRFTDKVYRMMIKKMNREANQEKFSDDEDLLKDIGMG